LYTRYCEAKPMLKEWEDAKKLIRDRHESHPSGEALRLTGGQYHVDLSPRENQWQVANKVKAFAALKKVLGAKLADALGYTKKLVEAHVAADKMADFSDTLRTGSRDVTAVLILPKEAA
jgi:hypothetical protein